MTRNSFQNPTRVVDAEEGVAQLRQFLTSTQREVGLDDICAWDLTPSMLKKEPGEGEATTLASNVQLSRSSHGEAWPQALFHTGI